MTWMMVELQLFSCESNTLPLDHCDHCAHLESYHAEIVTEKPDIYTAVVNSVYLSHSLMIVAAADAYVVQEHQTSEKASRELPTELQIITIHIQPNSLKTTIHCSFTVFLSPSTRQRLCNSSFCHSFMHSVHEQNYWKSNEPISLKLGVITGPTNQKNWLTFGGAPDRLRIPDHLSIFLTIAE